MSQFTKCEKSYILCLNSISDEVGTEQKYDKFYV